MSAAGCLRKVVGDGSPHRRRVTEKQLCLNVSFVAGEHSALHTATGRTMVSSSRLHANKPPPDAAAVDYRQCAEAHCRRRNGAGVFMPVVRCSVCRHLI